jgi:CheY-like chemotaxis protein
MTARKILVIDDSRVIRNMVRDMLPPGNIEVVEAPDGIKGLEMIQKETPWMIMLDFLLPRMSGFEVYERLQQSRELSGIPLLLMSGRKEEVTSKISEPFEDKFFAFIEKPFEQKQLLAAIKKAIELSKNKPPVYSTDAPLEKAVEQAAPAQMDQGLLDRVTALEVKARDMEALQAKVKVLEQQVVVQHKQIQQLVAFIKQRIK